MTRKFFALLLPVALMLTAAACAGGSEAFTLRSPRACGAGEIRNVLEFTVDTTAVTLEDSTEVTVRIGLGGDGNVSSYEEHSMVLTVSAPGCLINGTPDELTREYPDYYVSEDFRATVKEHFLGYPHKYPNYYEEFTITFPAGDCSGRIDLTLINEDEPGANETAELYLYYASNGEVLWFSESALTEVNEKGRPVSADK